jgi:membrane protease YdiL (CAAX protease family)
LVIVVLFSMKPRFHPFVRLLFFALGSLLASTLLLAVIGAGLVVAALTARRDPTEFTNFLSDNALLTTVLFYPPILLWLWFCRRSFDRQTFASLGLRLRSSLGSALSGALCGVLTLSLLFGILWTCGYLRIAGLSPEWTAAGAGAAGQLALFAVAFLAVGFTEEVVFRGYVFHNLAAWFGTRGALWTQAVLFGLIHLGNLLMKPDASGNLTQMRVLAEWPQAFWDARWGIVNIALIGIFFALCYLKTGSLWFPIGFHAAWNFFLGCIFSVPVSGIKTFRLLDVVTVANSSATGWQLRRGRQRVFSGDYGRFVVASTPSKRSPTGALRFSCTEPSNRDRSAGRYNRSPAIRGRN